MTLQTKAFARKIKPDKKPEPNLPKPLLKNWSRFQRPDFAEKEGLRQRRTLPDENFCWPELSPKAWSRFLEPDKAEDEIMPRKAER